MTSPSRLPPPELAETRTQDHLKAAFSRDAAAAQLWAAFGRIAEIEGQPEAARLFREMAESEALGAQGHLDLLLRVGEPLGGFSAGPTPDNLRAAAALQAEQASEGLPEMARTARAEGFPDIASWFESVAAARAVHAARLDAARSPR
jgi:rubrerythrin